MSHGGIGQGGQGSEVLWQITGRTEAARGCAQSTMSSQGATASSAPAAACAAVRAALRSAS